MSSIGQRISQIRKKMGLSQQELANKLGLQSRQSIYEYESDKTDPTIKSLKILSQLSGCTIDWIINGKNEPDKNSYLTIPTVLSVRESEDFYIDELSESEKEIFLLLRSKPELASIILSLIKNKIQQDELMKKMEDL